MALLSIHKTGSLVAQTILFNTARWSVRDAVAWAHENGYKPNKITLEKNHCRLQIVPPNLFQPGTYKTLSLRPGVKLVAARLAGRVRRRSGPVPGRFPGLIHWHNAKVIQSVLIPRDSFTWVAALRWSRDHGFRTGHKIIAVPAAYYRLQVLPEKMFSGSLSVLPYQSGVKFMVGRLESYKVKK